MNAGLYRLLCGIVILSLVLATGCVAPPKEKPPVSPVVTGPNGEPIGPIVQETIVTPTTPMFVTIATPYGTEMTSVPTIVKVPAAATPVPDEYFEIYRATQYFAYNRTAITFDLKNPPMIINFTLKTTNVTDTHVIDSRKGGHTSETVTTSYYNPQAYYEVTVRNRTTGEILAQNGFQHGYDANPHNRTMKILNRGDLLIEMAGNNVTANIGISVKKTGNLDNMFLENGTPAWSVSVNP